MKIKLKLTFLILLTLLLSSAKANFNQDEPWFASKDLLIKNKTYLELFGGAVYPDMIYSEKSYIGLTRKSFFMYDAGISLKFQRGKWFSFSPRLTYMGQGISMNDNMLYSLQARYVSFSFPFELQLGLTKQMNKSISKIFFYAGPYIATPVSIHLQTKEYSKWLSLSEVKMLNWGGEAGVGIRIPTYSLDGGSNITIRFSYLRGLNDTYTSFEKDLNSQNQGDQFYLDGGKRYNSALKLTIGIEIPIKVKKSISFTAGGDGKKNYKRVVVVDEK
jgi:hypothetical protein